MERPPIGQINTALTARSRIDSNEDEDEGEREALDLFLLKPTIKDFFDMIQLSWTLSKVQISQRDIRNQLARNEREANPAVWEVMESLYPHEHRVITKELSGTGSEASLASLKRTKADIQHRGITFQGVPGLHFVLRRRTYLKARPELEPEGREVYTPIEVRSIPGTSGDSGRAAVDRVEQEAGEAEYDSLDDDLMNEAVMEVENEVFPTLTRDSDLFEPQTFSDFVMVSDMAPPGGEEVDSYPKNPNHRSPSVSQPEALNAAKVENDHKLNGPPGIRDFRPRKCHESEGPDLQYMTEPKENGSPRNHLVTPPNDSHDRRFILAEPASREHWALGLLNTEEDLQPFDAHSTQPDTLGSTPFATTSYFGSLLSGFSDQKAAMFETDNFGNDDENNNGKTEMEKAVIDLLGKYTTLFEPQGKGKTRIDPLLSGGLL